MVVGWVGVGGNKLKLKEVYLHDNFKSATILL